MSVIKELLLNIVVMIIVLICILLLPIILPLVALHNKREKRKLRQLADQFVCLECGSIIGAESLRLADDRWSEIVKKIMSDNDSEIRLRLARTLDAVCPHCGCIYIYRQAENTFVICSEVPDWKEHAESKASANEL